MIDDCAISVHNDLWLKRCIWSDKNLKTIKTLFKFSPIFELRSLVLLQGRIKTLTCSQYHSSKICICDCYKVECKDWTFSYVGESKRCWASRSVEHDPARAASKTSAIRHHAEVTDHNIHPRHGCILQMNVHNYRKRLFLESLHSKLDKNTADTSRRTKWISTSLCPIVEDNREHSTITNANIGRVILRIQVKKFYCPLKKN